MLQTEGPAWKPQSHLVSSRLAHENQTARGPQRGCHLDQVMQELRAPPDRLMPKVAEAASGSPSSVGRDGPTSAASRQRLAERPCETWTFEASDSIDHKAVHTVHSAWW